MYFETFNPILIFPWYIDLLILIIPEPIWYTKNPIPIQHPLLEPIVSKYGKF
jgi:hypothetical protein